VWPWCLAAAGLVVALTTLPSARQAVPRFENVQPGSGVGFVLANAATPEKRLIETMPGGLAAFAGHWIRVRLRGQRSNRDGLGAVVTIAGQRRTLTSAVGHASSVRQGVHFGLGTATMPPAIEVRWPSGRTQTVQAPGIDRLVEITEPEA
jgi:hypothetical protein